MAMKIPDEVRNKARDASDLLELLVRDCAKVAASLDSTEAEVCGEMCASEILARYGIKESE